MEIPQKVVSLPELKRNTGERGSRMWLAFNGIVYDVTDCPKWRTGMHEFLHFPGQDLTGEIGDAPHAEEVFKHDCVKIIGVLETEA